MNANADASLRALDAQIRLGEAELAAAARAREAGDAQDATAAKADRSSGLIAGAGEKLKLAAMGGAAAAALSVKAASDWQQSQERLVTSAGESQAKLGMVSAGMLQLSIATNTSTEQLQGGMYYVESAGFHGAAGLTVLKAAAQGAQAEGAKMVTVSNALTTALNAYSEPASAATSMTNQMVKAVSQGKMTLEDFAGSLSAVLPIAAASHLSFAEVGGAIATMTSQGMSARQAAQDVAASIRALINPNHQAANEMAQLGISSVGVARELGQRGLTGTIGYLAETVAQKMGPAGVVIFKTFNQSRTAAADAQMEMANLPPAIRGIAKAYADGTITQKQWAADLKTLPPLQANLAHEFATTEKRAGSFNDLLRSGNPVAQTFAGTLGKMMGGATGLNTALMLTGSHAATFKANVDAIGQSAKKSGDDIDNWSLISGETSFKMGQTGKAAKVVAISFGTAMLPAVMAMLKPVAELGEWIGKTSGASTTLAIVVGGLVTTVLAAKAVNAFRDVSKAVESTVSGIGSLIGKFTASTAETAAATAETQALTIAQQEQAVATGEAAVAQDGLDVAMSANPIGLIVIGIGLLIGVIILVVTHLKDFEKWGKEAFHFVEQAAESAWNWVKGHWPLLLVILTGPIGIAVLLIKDHWKSIVKGAENAIHDVEGWFKKLPGFILGLVVGYNMLLFHAGVALLEGLIHGIESAVGAVVGEVEHVGSSILHGIEGALGIGSPSKEGRIRGQFFGLGVALGITDSIPMVLGATHQLAQATLAGYSGGSSRPVAGAAGSYGGGGDTYIFNVPELSDPAATAQKIQTILKTLKRRNGGAPLGLD
jgi:TP901 family phage tail tape measure protein